jgi:hypothetical protein
MAKLIYVANVSLDGYIEDVVLLTMPGEWNPRLREFIRVAREVAKQRAA